MHKHHIVFRSQGGLDFNLNFKLYPGCEEHEGNNSPHRNREVDLELKRDMQKSLFEEFKEKDTYTVKEIAQKLGKSTKYFEKYFRKVQSAAGNYKVEDIVRRLMGGKLY